VQEKVWKLQELKLCQLFFNRIIPLYQNICMRYYIHFRHCNTTETSFKKHVSLEMLHFWKGSK